MADNESSVEITRLIEGALAGNRDDEDQLIYRMLDQLREAALRMIPPENGTILATDLVGQAWTRVFHGAAAPEFPNRAAFHGYMARAMRNLIVDHFRRKKSGQEQPIEAVEELANQFQANVEILDLEEALVNLERENLRQFETVVFRFYGGMTMQEIADTQKVSLGTAERNWRLARAKLKVHLTGHESA